MVDENGENKKFNDDVLAHVKNVIENKSLDYDIVLQILTTELQGLMKDPLKSNAINQDVYNCVIQNNEYVEDKNAIASVVTYL